jgi:predicted phosphohydrolase
MIESKASIEGSDNRKIYEREKLRIGMCIDKLNETDPEHSKKHILMIHYPPLTSNQEFTEFAEIISDGGVDICVYGHLHGKTINYAFNGVHEGTKYKLISADAIDFCPYIID